MNLTHRQLTMFRAIMLHGNLSRAADVTNSSQPTLSRELARLEHVLGFALFDRVRGRLRPTAQQALLQGRGIAVEQHHIGGLQAALSGGLGRYDVLHLGGGQAAPGADPLYLGLRAAVHDQHTV